MKKHLITIALSVCIVCPAVTATASVINLAPQKDNTLYQSDAGDTSNGMGEHLFAGSTGFAELRRALMAFDVAGAIPAGSTINSVSLTLNMSRCGPTCSTAVAMDLHRVDADWGEGLSDAGGQEGIPDAAQIGDATWLNNFYGSSDWVNAGGDFSGAVSGSQVVTNLGFYTWASTSQMVADVQSWLDNPSGNFGWILLGGESDSFTAKRFDSLQNAAADKRPLLRVDYTPIPEPSTVLFVAAGALGVFRLRRRRVN
ncbi:MAG: PEP-CTERM sorting domain-containing protein [Planctomycetes bacterium]|nr:PEP-CTERM sorting domain-containing protein [Planctomycetota bacterium]